MDRTETAVRDKLAHINELNSRRAALEEFERLHAQPLLDNMAMINNIYDIYKNTLKRIDPKAGPTETTHRKKFLFVVLYLFSPETLCVGIIKHKLRKYFTSVLKCAPTSVSRDCSDARFYYDKYPDFRDDVNAILSDVMNALFGGVR